MRIGYFITHYPYDKDYAGYLCGGMEVAAANLATGMVAKGHEVSVFTTSVDHQDSVDRRGDMTVYRYGANFKIAQANMSLALLWKPLQHDVDIVHAHAGNPPAPIAALRYARNKKKPMLVTYHMDAEANWGSIIRRTSVLIYNSFILNRILSYAKSIVAPAKDFADTSKFLKLHRDKVRVIPNGIDTDEFRAPYSKEECRRKLGLPDKASIILFVGALSPHKSPDVVLRAMPILKKRIPDIKLVFIGEGVLRRRLENTSRELGVEDEVEFVGFVNSPQKALWFTSSDVFALPSTQESFGIVILEAMACGTPVVATPVGGIPSLVKDGQTGLLVPPRDPESMARAVERLLGDSGLRRRLSEEGKRLVQDYSWSKIVDRTEELYQEVAG